MKAPKKYTLMALLFAPTWCRSPSASETDWNKSLAMFLDSFQRDVCLNSGRHSVPGSYLAAHWDFEHPVRPQSQNTLLGQDQEIVQFREVTCMFPEVVSGHSCCKTWTYPPIDHWAMNSPCSVSHCLFSNSLWMSKCFKNMSSQGCDPLSTS